MAFNGDNYWNPTAEEREAARQAAQEERERIIQEAIKNGATVNYMTSRLTLDEQETHICWDIEGNTIIDTSILKDITKCLKRGWEITAVTYYADTNTVAGMSFKGKSNKISILTI
jgi:hypothetical protein